MKAKFLNKYLLMSIATFQTVLGRNFRGRYTVQGEQVFFRSSDFELHYVDFLNELKGLIIETSDIMLVRDYICFCLNDIVCWDGFVHHEHKIILSKGHAIGFEFKLKKNIERYAGLIKSLCKSDANGYPTGLIELYNHTINSAPVLRNGKTKDVRSKSCFANVIHAPAFDVRFDFDKMKREYTGYKKTGEKILFIHDRLNYFKQWQLQHDIDTGGSTSGVYYRFSPKYYPNFEKLCKMELKRLVERLEFENNPDCSIFTDIRPTNFQKEPTSTAYAWNASDTDLLELSTALLKANAITRKDGKKMTQKELKEAFEQMFGMEIKDAKAKLANAAQRKKTVAPFLESLLRAFEEYTKERGYLH